MPPAPIRKNSKPPSNAPTPSARRCAASSSPPPAQPRRNCSPILDRCGGGRKSVYVRRDARSVSGGGRGPRHILLVFPPRRAVVGPVVHAPHPAAGPQGKEG